MTPLAPVLEQNRKKYLPALRAQLLKRHIDRSMIYEFTHVWTNLPSDCDTVPCPICYTAGAWGDLVEEVEPEPRLRCKLCGIEIELV